MNKHIAVAILDNARENSLLLKELLVKNFPTIQSVLLFSDPSDFIKSLRINSYEIVFLSDSIKNNSTNEDIPVFVKLIVPNLILISSSTNIERNVDYSIYKGIVIKPLKESAIINSVKSCFISTQSTSEIKFKDKIQIKTHSQFKIIKISDLAYVSSVNNLCSIFLYDSTKINSVERIGKLELRLPTSFIRIHKSFLVNIDAIVSIRYAGVDMFVVLTDGTELPVAYRKRALVRKTLASIVC